MPWVPELFSARVLARLDDEQRHGERGPVPYFAGILTGELDALAESFAGEPELHHPTRGRIRGWRAFEAFAAETKAWLTQGNVSVEKVEHVVTEQRGFEEVVVHVDAEDGRLAVPHAIVADRRRDGRLEELRIYYSGRPLSGHHRNRPPVLQTDPDVRESGVVADYHGALAAGDADAVVATFEPDGYAREPAGADHIHKGRDGLQAFYELLFSNGGGISLEHCAVVDDGRVCALEYNAVRWGRTELSPQAGFAVYVRGPNGKLAAARIYDDVEPPVEANTARPG